jgi:hypothetical protein
LWAGPLPGEAAAVSRLDPPGAAGVTAGAVARTREGSAGPGRSPHTPDGSGGPGRIVSLVPADAGSGELPAAVGPAMPQGRPMAAARVTGTVIGVMAPAVVPVAGVVSATGVAPVVGVMIALVVTVPDVMGAPVVVPMPNVMVAVRLSLLLASTGQPPFDLAPPLVERTIGPRPGEPELPPGRVAPHSGADAPLLARPRSHRHDPVHGRAVGQRAGDDRAAGRGGRDRRGRPDGPGEWPEQPTGGQQARHRERAKGRGQDIREAAESGHHAEGGRHEQARQRGPAAGPSGRVVRGTVRAGGNARRRGDLRWARTEVLFALLHRHPQA